MQVQAYKDKQGKLHETQTAADRADLLSALSDCLEPHLTGPRDAQMQPWQEADRAARAIAKERTEVLAILKRAK